MHNYNSILYIANLAAIEQKSLGSLERDNNSYKSKLLARNKLFKAEKFKSSESYRSLLSDDISNPSSLKIGIREDNSLILKQVNNNDMMHVNLFDV